MTQRSKYSGSLSSEYRPFLSRTSNKAASRTPECLVNTKPFSSDRSIRPDCENKKNWNFIRCCNVTRRDRTSLQNYKLKQKTVEMFIVLLVNNNYAIVFYAKMKTVNRRYIRDHAQITNLIRDGNI